MKIGILTFHDGINHGAFFQAFLLQQYLLDKGHKVSILNYKNRHHRKEEYKVFLATLSLPRFVSNLIKILRFRIAQRRLLVTPTFLTCHREVISRLSSSFDVIIIGSDVVWDYESSLLGADPIYFGNSLYPKWSLVSYAASIGSASIFAPDYLVQGMPNFDAISVRDKKTFDFAKKYTHKSVVHVVDPTLLLSSEKIVSLCKIRRSPKLREKYLLVYAHYLSHEIKSHLRSFTESKLLSTIVTGYDQDICAVKRTCVGPFSWLSLFLNSQYILTSTFHGVLFSIIFQKNFLVVVTPANESKIIYLLKDLNLEDRLIPSNSNLENLEKPIDWTLVNKLIAAKRQDSENYIDSILTQ